jgi:hypothetical protein
MQKKKPPILLGIVVLVLFGAVFIMGNSGETLATIFASKTPPTPPKNAPEVSKEQAQKDAMARLSQGKDKDLASAAVPKETTEVTYPAMPAIFKPKLGHYQPTPTESQTTGHWYDKASHEQVRQEELNKKHGN